MGLNTIDMNMQSLTDKRLTACLLLIILELFFDGEFKAIFFPLLFNKFYDIYTK